jgi:hypothetical protein
MVFNTVALFWSLIPAKGSSTEDASYKFVDNNVQKRNLLLQAGDIDLNGTSNMDEPASAKPRLFYRILDIFNNFGKIVKQSTQ